MKFLFIIPFYKPAHVYGGPTYSIPTICEALVKAGSQVTVYTTNANGKKDFEIDPEEPQNINGVQVHYFKRTFPKRYFFSFGFTIACFKNISRSRFDIIYIFANWVYPFLPACLAAKAANIPYIISPRASFKENAWVGKFAKKLIYHLFLERYLIQKASLIHYTTKLEADQSAWMRLSAPSVIVPNPINQQEFVSLPEKGLFRKNFKISENLRLILILGRIDPDKGLDIALKSINSIVRTMPNIILVIAGPEEENYIPKLCHLAKELGVEANILFTGLLSPTQRIEALIDADLLFSPSRSENFGMSIVEAMASGTPVIVSNQVGVSEIIQREAAGLVFPLDPDQMAKGIIELLNNPQMRNELIRKAKQTVNQEFSAEAVAMQYQQMAKTIHLASIPRAVRNQ